MEVILLEGSFRRTMHLVPADDAQAFWQEWDAEMERLYAIWAAGA